MYFASSQKSPEATPNVVTKSERVKLVVRVKPSLDAFEEQTERVSLMNGTTRSSMSNVFSDNESVCPRAIASSVNAADNDPEPQPGSNSFTSRPILSNSDAMYKQIGALVKNCPKLLLILGSSAELACTLIASAWCNMVNFYPSVFSLNSQRSSMMHEPHLGLRAVQTYLP